MATDGQGHQLCDVCSERVDPMAPGVYALVQGWAQNRSRGGANAISDRKDLGSYRHRGCHRYGNTPSLFGAADG